MSGAGDTVSGQRIGKYVLIRRLAVGGMAELFLARNTGLRGFEKIVVLKRILPHLAGNGDFVEMFLHEARLAATLEHPNVVHVSDFGRAGQDYFFVMAYVHGKDVLSVLRGAYRRHETLPLPHAVTITTGMAAGLHYAHEHVGFDGRPLGIVHRDISPANVLVTYDGHVKVVDFGIAKAAAQTSVTQAGVRKGKAAYMSPEQCRGRDVDRRSDIYSMGVVLWEMTTMTRLHEGDNDLAMMNQIVHHDARRPSEVVPDYPPQLEQIVMRCLARDRAQRFQTAEQLQLALEEFARTQQVPSSTRSLGQYMHRLFPVDAQTLPWVSGAYPTVPGEIAADEPTSAEPGLPTRAEGQTPAPTTAPAPGPAPVTARQPAPTPPAAAWSGPPAPAAFDPPITRSEVYGPPPPRLGWVLGGAALGTLVAVGGLWAGQSEPEPAPRAEQAAQAPAPPAESAPPTPQEVEWMLTLVNQPDPKLALDYPRRHRLLEQLSDLPGVAPRIDKAVGITLDLLQADQAPDPCAAFEDALARVERDPQPSFAQALQTARAPAEAEACAGLETRREALARSLAQGAD